MHMYMYLSCMESNMAAQNESGRACVAEPEQSSASATQDSPSNSQETEQEYDFVQEPDQDCFCPVSLELLVEPYLTSCCGHHISQQASNKLTREKKPCPMCKQEGFTAQVDKYFKRKTINTLRVRCPHKGNGCEWTGELGDLNYHSSSCPKRPWKCQYCHFESTFDIGTNHTPNCARYPLPCPNQCEIVTIPRCDAENHLLMCPLQLVECEFASAGCEVKVPRRDLARHMAENTQHHLMSATLLNLRLTRELHQKIEEKDQQIAELKQQLNEHEAKMTEQSKALTKDFDAKLTQLDTSLTQNIQAHQSVVLRKLSTVESNSHGVTFHELIFTKFRKCKADSYRDSDPFYSYEGGYKFKLRIVLDSNRHLFIVQLCLLSNVYNHILHWPIRVQVCLQMLNQRGDHDHRTCKANIKFDKDEAESDDEDDSNEHEANDDSDEHEANDDSDEHEANDDSDEHEANDDSDEDEANDDSDEHEANDDSDEHEANDDSDEHEANDDSDEDEANDDSDEDELLNYLIVPLNYLIENSSSDEDEEDLKGVIKRFFCPRSALTYDVEEDIEYLQNDCLKFKLSLKIEEI